MTITGKTFGPYRVADKLGEGGMGEVYRATDIRLGRSVALKILPAAFAGDPERVARFEREAKTLATLNHPNIAHVYGFEDGALAMELLEGETLRDRLKSGGLPPRKAIDCAIQIARGLAAAHERGIIHRDLKPENVFLTRDGHVKLLDFGLARTLALDASGATETVTSPGTVLGTVGYMAPEQVRGEALDARADLFALGAVLYEMLTGQLAFRRETPAETMSAVLRDDPPEVTESRADLHPALEQIVRHCLEKVPAERFQTARDVAFALEALSGSRSAVGFAARRGSSGRWRSRERVAWVAACLALASLAAWFGLARRAATAASEDTSGSPSIVRFAIPPAAGVAAISNVAIAADASVLVFESASGNLPLFVRRLDQTDAAPLPGTEGARWPFLSPDNRWVAFFRNGKLQKVALSGGEVLTLADARGGPGAAWGHDRRIVYAESWSGGHGLYAVSDDGGTPTAATTLNDSAKEKGHWWPAVLPDGTHVLLTAFMSGAGLNDNRIAVADLTTGQSRALFPGVRPYWLNSGHIVFFHAGRYQAIRFDAATLQTQGDAVPVLPDALQLDPTGDWPQPVAVAANGAVAYVPGQYVPDSRLAWVRDDGSTEPLAFPARPYVSVAVAPDDARVAAASLEGGRHVIRIGDLRSGSEELLDLEGMNWGAAWEPAGNSVAFSSIRKGDIDVYVKDLSREGTARPLLDGPEDTAVVAWTRTGDLITRGDDGTGGYRLQARPSSRPDAAPRIVSERVVQVGASLSPDERWVAYSAAIGSGRQIFVQSLDGSGAAVSVASGTHPVFARRGNRLLFRRGAQLVARGWREVNGRFEPIGAERILSDTALGTFTGYPGRFDTTSDGRVLALVPAAAPAPVRIEVVLGWSRLLSRAGAEQDVQSRR